MEDMQKAKLRLPDNPYIRLSNLIIYLSAAELYGETGQTDKQKAAWSKPGATPGH